MKREKQSNKHQSSNNGFGMAIGVIGGLALGALGTLIGTQLLPELFDEPKKETTKAQPQVVDSRTTYNSTDIESFCDPITSTVFTDPQVTTCGHTFDKKTLIDWIKKSGTCPTCRKQLGLNSFVPNYQLKEAIHQITNQNRH